MPILDDAFYRRDDVVAVGRSLIGKVLCTNVEGVVTRLVITETEAYDGPTDRASHAYGNRRTKRTEPLFADGGIAYVYLCYGIHHMFNVVSGPPDVPHAVLVRAGRHLTGLDTMLSRRGKPKLDRTLLAGPGSVGKALGITTAMTALPLSGEGAIWIEDVGIEVPEACIDAGPRIGIDYAGEDASLPYRFVLNGFGVGQWFDDYRDLGFDPVG